MNLPETPFSRSYDATSDCRWQDNFRFGDNPTGTEERSAPSQWIRALSYLQHGDF
jgi:hypothetical protein